MTFRKDYLSFFWINVTVGFMSVLILAIMFLSDISLALLYGAFCAATILLNFVNHNQYITVNEVGISCHNSKKQLWAYEWGDIYMLRKCHKHNNHAIGIATYYKHAKPGEPDFYIEPAHYFELGKDAKKALAMYSSYTEPLLKK